MPSDELFRAELAIAFGQDYTGLTPSEAAVVLDDLKAMWQATGGARAWGTAEKAVEGMQENLTAEGVTLSEYVEKITQLYTQG